MPITFLQFKTAVRSRVFPAGEARNLRTAHDKSIVDALIDLQRWVECLQKNNTHLVPHCATYFNCGLTSFDFPRARIMRLSVIDKINPETGREDATAADDYCSEIEYQQVDACHIRNWLGRSREAGCFGFTLSGFFAIPAGLCGNKNTVPVPTDEGVPAGLPSLQLGYHYPQESTDSTFGRAQSGVWAVEGGRVMVAPWIQTTETVVVKWNGIKRDWVDADLVDDDPGLFRAVELFLRWEHARDWDRDANAASLYELEYRKALSELMYDCAEENRVRNCASERDGGAGGARGIAPVVNLFYNDQQQATEPCPANQTGEPVTVIVPAGTVASTISKGDANQKARDQAHEQALDQLDCQTGEVIYYNRAVIGQASCPVASGDTPAADGEDVSVTIPKGGPGHGYSSTVSEDAATDDAQEAADALAAAQLSCTFHNSPQTASKSCTDGSNTQSYTVLANSFEATTAEGGQAKANQLAFEEAERQATLLLAGLCPDDPVEVVCNDYRGTQQFFVHCHVSPSNSDCQLDIRVDVPAGVATAANKTAANLKADAMAQAKANQFAAQQCAILQSGSPSDPCPEEVGQHFNTSLTPLSICA